jgi:hypothetical protein
LFLSYSAAQALSVLVLPLRDELDFSSLWTLLDQTQNGGLEITYFAVTLLVVSLVINHTAVPLGLSLCALLGDLFFTWLFLVGFVLILILVLVLVLIVVLVLVALLAFVCVIVVAAFLVLHVAGTTTSLLEVVETMFDFVEALLGNVFVAETRGRLENLVPVHANVFSLHPKQGAVIFGQFDIIIATFLFVGFGRVIVVRLGAGGVVDLLATGFAATFALDPLVFWLRRFRCS